MKIPTSTSFVMAATASLALQSSARAVPVPDSPDIGGMSHSARAGGTADFAGGSPAIRADSGRDSSPSPNIKLRETNEADAASTESLDGLLHNTLATLEGLGIDLKADKNAENANLDASSQPLSARQLPATPPGVPAQAGSLTGMPGQIFGGVPQPPTFVPGAVGGVINGLPGQGAPPAQVPPSVYYPNIPGAAPQFGGGALNPPGTVAGVPQQLPNPLPAVQGIAGGVAGGVTGAQPLSGVTGAAGQVLGGFPNGLPNPLGSLQGAPDDGNGQSGDQADPYTSNGDANDTDGSAQPTVTSDGSGATGVPQGQGDPGQNGGDDGNGNGTASPSSTIATPSSSPTSSPVFTSATDQAPPASSDSDNSVPAPTMVDAEAAAPSVPVSAPSAPTSGLPIPSNILTPSIPVSVPTPDVPDSNAPDRIPQEAPSSLPVSLPPAPSAPVSLPVSDPAPSPPNAPLPPLPIKRTLTYAFNEPPSPPLPSGFPAPSAPIPGDTPPLLQSSSEPDAKDAGGIDAYSSSSASFDNRFSVGSATTRSATSMTMSSSTSMDMGATASSLPSRRRYFKFAREENA